MAMRVAVIGYGSIGQRHAKNLEALGCNVGVYDIDTAKTNRWHPKDLSWSSVDAVVIATPYETHLEYVQRAWAEDVPFFVEKPLGSIEQIEAWRELARSPSLPLHQVGYQCRFHPDAQTIKQREGKRIVSIKCHVDMRTWPGTYGDPLLECSHDIDLALWWGASPKSRLVDQSALSRPEGPGDWFHLSDGGVFSDLWFRYQTDPWIREWSCDGTPCGYQTAFWKANPVGDQVYVDEMKYFVSVIVAGGVQLRVGDHGPEVDDFEAATLADGIKVLEVCQQVRAKAEKVVWTVTVPEHARLPRE